MRETEVAIFQMASVHLNTDYLDRIPRKKMTCRRAQNRPVDETDFTDVKLFADGGLHWTGVHDWFGRPVDETRRTIFEAWPDLFIKIEASTERFAKAQQKQTSPRFHR